MSRLPLSVPLASLLLCACAGASPDRTAASGASNGGATTADTAASGSPTMKKPAGDFKTFTDDQYEFQIDFFGAPDRGPTKSEKLPGVVISGYAATLVQDQRAQILNVQVLDFPDGKTPEKHRCKPLLPPLLRGMAVDRMECKGPLTNPVLLEHDPAGVYSVTGDVSDCAGFPAATVHVACDEREDGKVVTYSLATLSDDAKDPMNRWFLCSLLLKGHVITCPFQPH